MTMKIIRHTTMLPSSVYGFCNKFNLYTKGTNSDYNNLLHNLCVRNNPTDMDIYEVAKDICDHSEIPVGIDKTAWIENIMYEIANSCCGVHFEIVE